MTGELGPVTALLAAAADDWHVERNEPMHVWTAEKTTNDGRSLHFIVAYTASELTGKILSAEHGWDCEAYGPDGRAHGALCFFSGGLGKRVCAGPDECRAAMAAERQRVFARIQDLAASGDETGRYLAEQFTEPGQLLGGPGDGRGTS